MTRTRGAVAVTEEEIRLISLLAQQGLSFTFIAEQLGLERTTIRRYAQAALRARKQPDANESNEGTLTKEDGLTT
jgi:DNA-binding NarL/FixJ family response regulator